MGLSPKEAAWFAPVKSRANSAASTGEGIVREARRSDVEMAGGVFAY